MSLAPVAAIHVHSPPWFFEYHLSKLQAPRALEGPEAGDFDTCEADVEGEGNREFQT